MSVSYVTSSLFYDGFDNTHWVCRISISAGLHLLFNNLKHSRPAPHIPASRIALSLGIDD